MVAAMQPLIDKVWQRFETTGSLGRTVTLKVKFFDFEIMSRSKSTETPIGSRDDLDRIAVQLLKATTPLQKAVRLLGVSLLSLQREDNEDKQLGLPI